MFLDQALLAEAQAFLAFLRHREAQEFLVLQLVLELQDRAVQVGQAVEQGQAGHLVHRDLVGQAVALKVALLVHQVEVQGEEHNLYVAVLQLSIVRVRMLYKIRVLIQFMLLLAQVVAIG